MTFQLQLKSYLLETHKVASDNISLQAHLEIKHHIIHIIQFTFTVLLKPI